VESSIGHRRRRFPYAFSGIGGAEFSKKCDLIPSEHKWRVIGYKVALDQERRISDTQIEDQTETDLTLRGVCEMRQKFDASRCSALESAGSVEKPTPEVRFLRIRLTYSAALNAAQR
jgi:hypothetical protein